MTLVIRLGNLLEKHKEREPVQEYLAKMEESYHKFVTGELKIANDRNSRNLGGQQSRVSLDEEDENDKEDYDVNLQNIMSKFSNFNAVITGSINDDDDDEIEEKIDNTQEEKDAQNNQGVEEQKVQEEP